MLEFSVSPNSPASHWRALSEAEDEAAEEDEEASEETEAPSAFASKRKS